MSQYHSMVKMEIQFLVVFIGIFCMGLTSVRSDKLNPDQSKIHGNIYNLFDSVGTNDVEKIRTYRKILEVETMEEQQAFNAMKDTLVFAKKRNADNHEDYNLYLTSGNTNEKAAIKLKRKAPGSHDERVDFSTTMKTPYELGCTNDLKALKSLLEEAKYKPDSDFLHQITAGAAQRGHLDLIRYMVQEKPPILTQERYPEITFTAAEFGHLKVVQYMFEEILFLEDQRTWDGNTIAAVAAKNGRKDILLYMLDKRPDSLLEYNKDGVNALYWAARTTILDVKTLKLLEEKSSYSARKVLTKDRELICSFAAKDGNLDVVKYFMEQDPSFSSKTYNEFQSSIAREAASSGQCNVFWYLVQKDSSFLMKKDGNGNYPLLLAVKTNCVRATKLESLVEKYHIPLGETNNEGETMAHMAAESNSLDIIIYIEEREPSILNKRSDETYFSDTVAGVAAERDHWEIVKYLAKKNSSVYTEMMFDESTTASDLQPRKTIFYMCIKKNLLDCGTLKWLLEEEKAPLNLHEIVDNRNLAQLAIENKNLLIFNLLVKNELSLLYHRVNGSKTGPTVAHLAVQEGYFYNYGITIISAAVEKIPSIFREKDGSNHGNSVLHAAIERGMLIDAEMLERLLNGKHVSLSETNENGDTIAHAAAAAPDDSNYKTCYSKAVSAGELRRNLHPSFTYILPSAIPVAEQDEAHLITYIAKRQASLLAQKNNNGDTIVHVAAKKGHVFALRAMAKACSPAIFRTTDRQKNSVLHLLVATAKPQLYYFKMLVEEGVPIMSTNWQGETAAHIAARNGLLEIVEYLIKKEPAVVRIKNTAGRTIALTAAENAHFDIIGCITDKDSLLEKDYLGNTVFHLIMESNTMKGSDFNNTFRNISIPVDLLVEPNNQGLSAIHLAAQVGCEWIIEKIAAQDPRILIEKDHNGDSALSYAVAYQQDSVIIKILSKNPKLETQNIQALFQCPNEKKLLNVILKMEENIGQKLDWNQRHFDGIAIHSAIESGYSAVLKHFLEKRGVDVNQPNEKGEPPIFTAARFKHLDMLRYLVEQRGADLLITDDGGNNILFVATENDDLSTIKYVLDERKAPIDVNWRNKIGDSILHAAVRASMPLRSDWGDGEDHGVPVGRNFPGRDSRRLIKKGKYGLFTGTALYLIEEKHANVNLLGQQNKTVFAHAAEQRRYDICAYLRAHGADEPYPAESQFAPTT